MKNVIVFSYQRKGEMTMKKTIAKILSLVLAVTLLISGTVFSANAKTGTVGDVLLEGLLKGLIGGINLTVPAPKSFKDIKDKNNDQFYEGTGSRLDEPGENAQWSLGYSQVSLIPDDWESHTYYLGGFIDINNGFVNKVETVLDDMRARVIAISDGSGRGVTVFATVDCIGMTNADIRNIRKAVENLNLGVELSSINVCSTHCHSCIDTEGLWTNLLPKAIGNLIKAYLHIGTLEQGTDKAFMDQLITKVAGAVKDAVGNMKPGTLTYAQKTLSKNYFSNKNRKSCTTLIDDLTRLVFTPDDETIKPTMVVNIAAHPDIVGLPTDSSTGREVSGDYIYYMGRTVEEGGYNFMFFNGAIAGIYIGRGPSNDDVDMDRRYMISERYGTEIGNIALCLTKTYDEIDNWVDHDKINADKANAESHGGHYTLWYEDWQPVEEVEVSPLLNVHFREVKVKITNPLIQLAGKLNLANYNVYREGRDFVIFVEIGYMEIGGHKIALMPGEVVQDLVEGGGSLTADGSYSGKDFGYKSIDELFGEETVAFGLVNDAIGYVVPDNDYCMSIINDHYQELISLGGTTASSVMQGFADIAEDYAK